MNRLVNLPEAAVTFARLALPLTLIWREPTIQVAVAILELRQLGFVTSDHVFLERLILGSGHDVRVRCGDNEPWPAPLRITRLAAHGADTVTVYVTLENDDHWLHICRQLNRKRVTPAMGNPPRLPGKWKYSEEARQQRLAFLRERTGLTLECMARNHFQAEMLLNNIESFIGAVEVPLGIAGPLLMRGQHATDEWIFAPLATSEGALIASVTRGARALSEAGGVTARVLGQHITRVPVFDMANIDEAISVACWVQSSIDHIRDLMRRHSSHAQLLAIEPQLFGKSLHLQFIYETGDAAGQNMTTNCTWHACAWILAQLRQQLDLAPVRFLIEGNLSGDKKASFQSMIRGRGVRVVAECLLPNDVVRDVLKVEPAGMLAGWHHLTMAGQASGMIATNVNIANLIAGIFTATGQDIASVHESSIGQFQLRTDDDGKGLYACVVLPGLMIGTVGGGTGLPQQRECLELLGCAGNGKVARLAEIIAGYALALDLSTLAAISAGHFAHAHEKIRRQRAFVKFSEEPVILQNTN